MIKAVIFDFDGVLVDSTGIKTEAFRKISSKWPDKVDDFIVYHRKNMGISRYIKFEYFYKNIIHEPYSKKIELSLSRQFSELVVEAVKNAPFVEGAREFLENACEKYLLFVASGTPQGEIDDIVSSKKIDKYFRSVFGSPLAKSEIIRNILVSYSLNKKEAIFIGDAESDKIAADETGIRFILRANSENKNLQHLGLSSICNINQLKTKIEEIRK